LLYFYRNTEKFSDWQAVILYPSRSIEQSKVYPHRSLLNGPQVHRIYLDELGDVWSLPVPIAAVVLTIIEENEAPAVARHLLQRTEQETFTPEERSDIIDIVTSIMVYKLATLSRTEIKAMLGLDLTVEPRAIREAKDEGREEQTIALIIRLLTRRLGQEISEAIVSRLTLLALPVLEDLSEALLDFTTLADLENWLAVER
jgi:predicted transposase YdaD